MLKSQLIAALLLVLTPLVAWSTMTITWGPNRTYWVNGYEGNVYSGPSVLSVDPEYIGFSNGAQFAKYMRSSILFDNINSTTDDGVEVMYIVSANSSMTIDDDIEEIAHSAVFGSDDYDVFFVGDYKEGQTWVEMSNNHETYFYSY